LQTPKGSLIKVGELMERRTTKVALSDGLWEKRSSKPSTQIHFTLKVDAIDGNAWTNLQPGCSARRITVTCDLVSLVYRDT
jgi:hypothetical protein